MTALSRAPPRGVLGRALAEAGRRRHPPGARRCRRPRRTGVPHWVVRLADGRKSSGLHGIASFFHRRPRPPIVPTWPTRPGGVPGGLGIESIFGKNSTATGLRPRPRAAARAPQSRVRLRQDARHRPLKTQKVVGRLDGVDVGEVDSAPRRSLIFENGVRQAAELRRIPVVARSGRVVAPCPIQNRRERTSLSVVVVGAGGPFRWGRRGVAFGRPEQSAGPPGP